MVKALTFDVFGTVFDLEESFRQPIEELLKGKSGKAEANSILIGWRQKQRQLMLMDSLMMKGHHSYKTLTKRALIYVLSKEGVEAGERELESLMRVWYRLKPYPDVEPAMRKMKQKGYKLAYLSNGDKDILDGLAKRIDVSLDGIFSAEEAEVYKPHPKIYQDGVRKLGLKMEDITHVAAHLFDIFGSKACGMRAIYVKRHEEPYEPSDYSPDYTVRDFHEILTLLS